jgi:hypothetical protein
MQAIPKTVILWAALGLQILFSSFWHLPAQEAGAPAGGEKSQAHGDPLAELSPADRALFDQAGKAFQQEEDSEANESYRKLLPHLNGGSALQIYVAKIASESAPNIGDKAFALDTLRPIAEANANDWQAASLLARYYAESGEKQLRDRMIARVVELHKRAADAQIGKLQCILLERVDTATGKVLFFYSLEPWGRFNTCLMARIYSNSGEQTYRIAVESSDVDQAFIETKTPGARRFSYDGYGPPQKHENGTTSYSQALLGFFDGTFDYDVQKAKILKLAEGHRTPTTTTQ